MNPKPSSKSHAFIERVLALRPFWAAVVVAASLLSFSLPAQTIPGPDVTPEIPPRQVEPMPVTPTDPAEPQTPAEPKGPPIRPEGESPDETGSQSGGQVPTVANDIFFETGSDEAYAADALVADTIARVETELRKVLKISATEPGVRVRVLKGAFLGASAGLWRYLSADNIQVWARWILPTNTSSGLKLFAQYQYKGPYSGDSAEFFNPANYAISEESRLYVQDTDIGGQIASWTPGRPVNFWTLLTREVPGGWTFTVESLTAELAPLTNLSVNGDAFGERYFTVSADLTTSPEFPGLQPILDVQRKLRRISEEGTRKVAAVPGPAKPTEPVTPEKPAEPVIPDQTTDLVPADRSDVTSETSPAIKPESPVEPARPPVLPQPVDGTVSEPAQIQPNPANDVFTMIEGAAPFADDATVSDIITRVEGKLREALKVSATDTGLRVRVDRQPFGNRVTGLWRYLGADDVQAFARWSYPSNDPAGLRLFVDYQYAGPLVEDPEVLSNPDNFEISPNNLICLMDLWSGVNTATWASNTPVRFISTVSTVRSDESTLTADTLRSVFSSLSNLDVQNYANGYFSLAGDVSDSNGLTGIQPLIDVQRLLLKLVRDGTRKTDSATVPPEALAPTSDTFVAKARSLANPVRSPAKSDRTAEPATTETVLTANGGLQGLTLQADYPKIEIAENGAYIPLYFTVLGTYTGTNDVVVRARFISGTATPGADFELGEQERSLPAQGGLTTMAWISVPTLLDEVNEGDETAVFEVFIVGSTNAPIRIEATLLEDSNPGQVGFVSTRFQINEGSTNGYAQIRLWRSLNTRQAATVSYRLEGPASALAVLGGQTNRTATFEPGQSQIFVQIPLVNNSEAQGTLDVTLTLESIEGGLKLMKGLESTVLTLADDETPRSGEPLTISQYDLGGGQRGAMLSTRVSRGYQVRLEYSDTGVAGPWQLYWLFEGSDVERVAFDSFDTSVMRMYRILPPEPLDFTFPW